MLANPHDKPILSDRSQTLHRDRVEDIFARTLGIGLVDRGKSADLNNLKFALTGAIAIALWGLWRKGINLGGNDADRELRLIGWKSPAKFALKLENLPARKAILDRINLLSGNVADAEFDRIKEALGENIKGDISREDLVSAISQVLGGDRFTARARTIARTELTSAYNIGRVQTYRENSVQAVRRYCIRDERTCPTCASMNGMVARLNSGDLSKLLPPSHPNCRCIISPIADMRQLIEAGRKLRSDIKSGWEIEAIINS